MAEIQRVNYTLMKLAMMNGGDADVGENPAVKPVSTVQGTIQEVPDADVISSAVSNMSAGQNIGNMDHDSLYGNDMAGSAGFQSPENGSDDLFGPEDDDFDEDTEGMEEDGGWDSVRATETVPVEFDLDGGGSQDEEQDVQSSGQETVQPVSSVPDGSMSSRFSGDSLVREFEDHFNAMPDGSDIYVPPGAAVHSDVPGSQVGIPADDRRQDFLPVQEIDRQVQDADMNGRISFPVQEQGRSVVQDIARVQPVRVDASRKVSRWSDFPVAGAYRDNDGQMFVDKGDMPCSSMKNIPQHMLNYIRDQFPAATSMNDALSAYVYVHEGCPADMAITQGIADVAKSYRGPESDFTNETLYDNLLKEFDSLSGQFSSLMSEFNRMKTQYMTVIAKVSAVEMAIVYDLCDRIGFRTKAQDSPATINFLESCVSDMMAQLERESAMKTSRDAVKSGRPIR